MPETAHDIELLDGEELHESSIVVSDGLEREENWWKQFDTLDNPDLDDPKFKSKAIKVESPKHRAAFLYWMQLAPSLRTDKAVSDHFKVSAAVVGKWRKSFNWQRRLELILKEDIENAIAVSKQSFADNMNLILSASTAALRLFKRKIDSGEMDVSVKDFVLLSQEMRAVKRELMEVEDDGSSRGGNNPMDRIEGILNSFGESNADILVKALQVEIMDKSSGQRVVEKVDARQEQTLVELCEIGEDEAVDFDGDSTWEKE